jgi:DUSAM domain-containing protein
VAYTSKPPEGDWEAVWRLADRLKKGEAVPADPDTLALLDRLPAQVGLEERAVAWGLGSAEGRAERVRAGMARIADGSRRLAKALLLAEDLAGKGRLDAARATLREVAEKEPVPFHREVAATRLKELGAGAKTR